MPRALPQSSRFLYVAGTAIFTLGSVFDANRPEIDEDILEHFKYGSIGAEERAGIPYSIWRVLPRMFPQHLPERPGDGYERFGFIFEPGKQHPIGISLGSVKSSFLGLNCAVCHTGTVRDTQGGKRQIVLGMPAHQIDLQSYQRFLFKTIADPQFTPENVWAAIRAETQAFPGSKG